MKIVRLHFWKENLELTKPYSIAYRTIDSVENIFLYLELENGVCGAGSGSPGEFVTGESVASAFSALTHHAEELLLGKDIREYRSILNRAGQILPDNPAARAAIDIALHDTFARWLGIPLADLLGRAHQGFPTSITIGIKSVEETLQEAEEHIRSGFRVIKLKIGKSVEEDMETFSRLRERVGPGIKIRIDANKGYSPADLERFLAFTHRLDVEFVEQPLPEKHLQEMLTLPESIRKECAADEDLHHPGDALQMACSPQPYGIFNIKLMKCGGIQPALSIADIAEKAGIHLMWGCNDESIISISAALHAALACPATRYLDLDGSFDLARDVVSGGFMLKDGLLYTNGKAGLGVEWIEKPLGLPV